MHHVAQEVGLPVQGLFRRPDVREHVDIDEVLRLADEVLLVIQRLLVLLDLAPDPAPTVLLLGVLSRFLERAVQHFENRRHLLVAQVVDDTLEDVEVREDAHGPE